ncbi:ornithine carbamoyltransferase [Azospirillum fermentarium]|uniref:ornithine carbamoyltransferase n=1 Tax=Azospirillum fermentarium TaxID=1233114 RepID=UPI002225F12B|nr:ornithine carbamoyltransferase [Azospirillum fermentarium]MCW2247291.1 ornithine carbamoyltransferase [Azospirillum fermentarium]
MTSPRHFLDIHHFDTATLRGILDRAVAMKRDPAAYRTLASGRTLAMLFEKPSTRTRVSFEVGMAQLGGTPVVLRSDEMQLGRGETIPDTARVLSRFVDAIMIRTGAEQRLLELAKYASVPVINALTNESHPCQIMADLQTFEERLGTITGRTVAWVGDANNVAASWVHAAVRFGFELRLACPPSLCLSDSLVQWAKSEGGNIVLLEDPAEAVRGADCVVTDAWVSMNHTEEEMAERYAVLGRYQVNDALMALAAPHAIFQHCLPAHRGEEVTDSVMDGHQSAVWDEAENRLHAQKAVLAWCLGL